MNGFAKNYHFRKNWPKWLFCEKLTFLRKMLAKSEVLEKMRFAKN